jgi:hypothetical protein
MRSPAPFQRRSFVITLGLLTAVAAFTVDVSLPAVPVMVEALATDLSRGQQIVGIFMVGMAFGRIGIDKTRATLGIDSEIAVIIGTSRAFN